MQPSCSTASFFFIVVPLNEMFAVGCQAHGPVEQGTFLQRMGIVHRVEALLSKLGEEDAEAQERYGLGTSGTGFCFLFGSVSASLHLTVLSCQLRACSCIRTAG